MLCVTFTIIKNSIEYVPEKYFSIIFVILKRREFSVKSFNIFLYSVRNGKMYYALYEKHFFLKAELHMLK